jgi:DNA-binding PadR family transcriptional regulator
MSDMTIPKDLVAASAIPIVLAILRRADSYGYAIIQKVREVSQNQLTWSDGMLYPVLHRLEAAGLISSHWQVVETGRKRKYYQLNAAGAAEFRRLKEQWLIVHNALESLSESTDAGE